MSRKPILTIVSIILYFDNTKLISKGENSYNSGHVQKTQFDKNLGIVKANVLASMKKKAYKVEICMCDHQIISSSCDCPRGLDICHHMCAVAFFIHCNVSITDLACTWNVMKSKDDAKTAEECFSIKSALANFKPIVEDIEEAHINFFYENLKECGPTGFSWLLSPEPLLSKNDCHIPNIEHILFSQEFHVTKNKNEYLQQKLLLTLDQVLRIQEMTIGQTDNPLWLFVRKNRITASNFGKIIRAHRRGKFPPSLYKTLSGSYNLDGIKQIQWGRNNKKVAIEAFEKINSSSVKESGIWLSLSGVLGANPDGLLEDTIVEVKCPYKYRNSKLGDV